MSSTDKRTIALIALAGIAIMVALWMLAISPKREERTQVRDNVAAQQERLQSAQSVLASYQASRKEFPDRLSELRRLDKAVPARAAIADLLRQLQRRANVRNSDLRLVALKAGGTAAPAADAAAATTPLPPGASVGPDGLAVLPFTFEFTGEYFALRDILATVRRSVSVQKGGDVKVAGRLLTIDGLTFTRPEPGSSQTKATLNATAYIAPDGASSPQPPAPAAAAPTAGGS
ncbi:MAG: hypothetical protein Q8O56_04885 [Solirubrobacteraceae bacterium]|nr:hypothetical protein [Solirubrobacteraceae bacterium]